MVDDLVTQAANVADERAFVQLLRLMSQDWIDHQKTQAVKRPFPIVTEEDGWQNSTTGQFLDCAAAWAEDTPNQASSNDPASM